MAIQLNGDDFHKLNNLLCRQSQWGNEAGRIALAQAAFAGEQKSSALRNRLHLAGSKNEAASHFIEELQNFGQITKDAEALGALLRYLKDHVGVDDEEFIDELFDKYPLIKTTPMPSVTNPPQTKTVEPTPPVVVIPTMTDDERKKAIERHLKFGRAAFEAGIFQEAIEEYSKAIILDSDNAEAYYRRGLVYRRLGESNYAISDYTQAILHDPDHATAYYTRGHIYDMLGEHDKAILDYTKAIVLKSDYSYAYYNRGNTYAKLGRNDRAVADYEQYLKRSPNAWDADKVRSKIVELKQAK